ncbi:MAG: xylulokinase, partial [Gemmatimonadaceae bacterium]|nr:xylulokinase [Gemmatimonadaceae bacterium]
MTLGIDIGTSGVKVALVDHAAAGAETVLASASSGLTVQRPHPRWSEQDPASWWAAVLDCVDAIHASHGVLLASCTAIGLSGQMHGATLMDASGTVLRPCMLWNDGRSSEQCVELESAWPASRRVTGNLAMPGFTAPKLLWVREFEREVFDRVAMVLLPKAYVRWRLCGAMVEEMSDASGTLWLDVGARRWSDEGLAACGLDRGQMPTLVEGSQPTGHLRRELA